MAAVGENVGSGAGLELGGLGSFIYILKLAPIEKIFLMIGAWWLGNFWVHFLVITFGYCSGSDHSLSLVSLMCQLLVYIPGLVYIQSTGHGMKMTVRQ